MKTLREVGLALVSTSRFSIKRPKKAHGVFAEFEREIMLIVGAAAAAIGRRPSAGL